MEHINCGGELQFIRNGDYFTTIYVCDKCGGVVNLITCKSGDEYKLDREAEAKRERLRFAEWVERTNNKLDEMLKHPERHAKLCKKTN